MRARPLVVFDGDCGFCRLWIARWREMTAGSVDYAPFQQAAAEFPHIPLDQFRRAVQLVEPDGQVHSGAAAVFRLLRFTAGGGKLYWLYTHVPGVPAVSEAFYRVVADHRPFFSRLTRLLWGSHVESPSYAVARQLFLRLLAAVYLIAFLSLYVQVPGLIGEQGILPVQHLLEAAEVQSGPWRYWTLPTLAWISPSDTLLQTMVVGGAFAALAGIAGITPGAALFLTWVLYLSLTVAGQDFLSFQWDILLLEAGFLGIWYGLWESRAFLWLLRLLLFRLVFSSGLVKLASGDPTWRNLTALEYHYETQPLPTPLGWFAHQLPAGFQHFSTAVLLGLELLVPFLIFVPRRPRMLGAWILIGLEILIALTGNYTFFNVLTIVLCVLLFDDAAINKVLPGWLTARLARRSSPAPPGRGRRTAVAALALVIGLAGMARVSALLFQRPWPSPVSNVLAALSRLYLVNSYGLFAVMTTSRPEIIVEGSNDGERWLAYEFKYKPGDVNRAPPFVAPHQPRLDWQMWFAALGEYRRNPWFVNFMVRLLEGSPEVLPLLAHNPFPEAPPRYIRGSRYEYRFTTLAERRTRGAWWRRDPAGLYFPASSLRER